MLYADIDYTQKTALSGQDHDKAIETLQSSINPLSSRIASLRKALGLKDLLIKVSRLHILMFAVN